MIFYLKNKVLKSSKGVYYIHVLNRENVMCVLVSEHVLGQGLLVVIFCIVQVQGCKTFVSTGTAFLLSSASLSPPPSPYWLKTTCHPAGGFAIGWEAKAIGLGVRECSWMSWGEPVSVALPPGKKPWVMWSGWTDAVLCRISINEGSMMDSMSWRLPKLQLAGAHLTGDEKETNVQKKKIKEEYKIKHKRAPILK